MTTKRQADAAAAAELEQPEPAPVPMPDPPEPQPDPEPAPPARITSLAGLTAALAADERPIERVQVPEWPGRPIFFLRGLTGHDRDSIENTTYGEGINDISAKLVARALCDEEGKPLVPRDAASMAAAEKLLTQRTAGGLLRLVTAAKRLSGMGTRALDDLEKILKADPSS